MVTSDEHPGGEQAALPRTTASQLRPCSSVRNSPVRRMPPSEHRQDAGDHRAEQVEAADQREVGGMDAQPAEEVVDL